MKPIMLLMSMLLLSNIHCQDIRVLNETRDKIFNTPIKTTYELVTRRYLPASQLSRHLPDDTAYVFLDNLRDKNGNPLRREIPAKFSEVYGLPYTESFSSHTVIRYHTKAHIQIDTALRSKHGSNKKVTTFNGKNSGYIDDEYHPGRGRVVQAQTFSGPPPALFQSLDPKRFYSVFDNLSVNSSDGAKQFVFKPDNTDYNTTFVLSSGDKGFVEVYRSGFGSMPSRLIKQELPFKLMDIDLPTSVSETVYVTGENRGIPKGTPEYEFLYRDIQYEILPTSVANAHFRIRIPDNALVNKNPKSSVFALTTPQFVDPAIVNDN